MRTVVILYWDHPLSIVEDDAVAMSRAFASLGFDVRLFGVLDENFYVKAPVVLGLLADPDVVNADLVISLGGPPLSIRVDDVWLFNMIGKFFLLLSMDALFYDHDRVTGVEEFVECAKESPRLGISWVDRDACEILDQLTAGPVFHLPPFAFFDSLECRERVKRVALVATMGGELADISPDLSFEDLVLEAAPALCQGRPLVEFAQALEQPGPINGIQNLAVQILGITAEDIYTNDMTAYLSKLDSFQKRRRRRLAVEALSDVPIDIFGPGWEPYTRDFSDCRHMGSIPYLYLPEVSQQYRVILDFNPGFGHGLHDRVYCGVGNGARVLTNSCRAIADLALPDPDAVISYDVCDAPNVAELARHALELPVMEPEPLLKFRAENSQLARMDKLTLRVNQLLVNQL